MSLLEDSRPSSETPVPTRNHLMGFVDTQAQAGAIIVTLKDAGVPSRDVRLFSGEEGLQDLEEIMRSSWGEADERYLKQAIDELAEAHLAVAIPADNLEQARDLVSRVGPLGGRSFTYFGTLVDTTLS